MEKLNELLEYLKQAIEFGKEQIPLVAQEIINYEWIMAWVYVALCAILSGLSAWAAYRGWKAHDECDIGPDLAVGFGLIVAIFAVAGIVCHVSTLIQIYIAPRLFLLNYVKGLL